MNDYYQSSTASKTLSKWIAVHSDLFFPYDDSLHQNPSSQYSNQTTDDNESTTTDVLSTSVTHSTASDGTPHHYNNNNNNHHHHNNANNVGNAAMAAVNAVGGAASAVASSSVAVASVAASTVTYALTGLVIGTIRTTGKVGSVVINASGISSGLRSMGIMSNNNNNNENEHASAAFSNMGMNNGNQDNADIVFNAQTISPSLKLSVLIVRDTAKGAADVIKSLAMSKYGNKPYIDCYVYDPILSNSNSNSNNNNNSNGAESQTENGLKQVEKELRSLVASLPSSKKRRDSRTVFLFPHHQSNNNKVQPEILFYGAPIQNQARRVSIHTSMNSSSVEMLKIPSNSEAPFGLDVPFDLVVFGPHALEYLPQKQCVELLNEAKRSLLMKNGAIILCCPKNDEDGLAKFRSGLLPIVSKSVSSYNYPVLYQREMARLLVEHGLSGTGSASGEIEIEYDLKSCLSSSSKMQDSCTKMLSSALRIDLSQIEKIKPGTQQQLLKGINAASGGSGKLSQTLVVFVGRVSYPYQPVTGKSLSMHDIKPNNNNNNNGTDLKPKQVTSSPDPLLDASRLRQFKSTESSLKNTPNSFKSSSSLSSQAKIDEPLVLEYRDLPSRECWWVTPILSSQESEKNSGTQTPNSSATTTTKEEFRNYGLEIWQYERNEWLTRTVKEIRGDPAPVATDEVIEGLTKESRTYELPGPMKLSEVMTLYQDIWDAEEDE